MQRLLKGYSAGRGAFPAGLGVVVEENGSVVHSESKQVYLEETSYAEFEALVLLARWINGRGVRKCVICAGDEVIGRASKKYKGNEDSYKKESVEEIRSLLKGITVTWKRISNGKNKAVRLATEARKGL